MPEFNADAKYLCDRLKLAADDFTSLGRWGWGLVVGFLSQLLLNSATAKGKLFAPVCSSGDWAQVGFGFLFVIVVGAGAYFYFLRDARRKVVSARTAVETLNREASTIALKFAAETAPSDRDLDRACWVRGSMFAVLVFVWFLMLDPELSDCWTLFTRWWSL